MSYRLEWIFQYRVLLSKATELHIALTPAEHSRLERLRAQLPSDVPELDSHADSHLPEPLRAEYIQAGRFHAGRVCNASGGGMAVLTAEPPDGGQHIQLHVWDPSHSVEYIFPVRVVGRISSEATGMRVVFEGLPAQRLVMTPALGSHAAAHHLDTRPTRHGGKMGPPSQR